MMNEIRKEHELIRRKINTLERLNEIMGHNPRFQKELGMALEELKRTNNHISVIIDLIHEGCE